MPEPDVLDVFLAAQKAEGRYFDTAGFTLNSLKALQKLSHHQLPDSGLWLVKLVQAAVAARADSITIVFGRKKVTVSFLPAVRWQADDLLETVLSGTLPQDRALMHLVTALRASSGAVTEVVSWSSGSAKVELNGDRCQVSDQPETDTFELVATRPSRSRSLSVTLTSSITQLVKQTVEESDALRSRCWVSPIPIKVDGQELPRGYDLVNAGFLQHSPWGVLKTFRKHEQAVMEACLAICPLSEESLGREIPYVLSAAGRTVPTGDLEIGRPVYRDETFLRWQTPSDPSRGAIVIVSGPQETDPRVDFVLDGAVVAGQVLEPWRLEPTILFGIAVSKAHLRARAVVGVDPANLDLSQFAVRESDLEALMKASAPTLKALIDKLEASLDELYYLPIRRKAAPWTGLGLGIQLTIMTAVSHGIALVPVAGMFAGVYAINRARWRNQIRKALLKLREKLSTT